MGIKYALKTSLMKSMIKKRKKQKPFNLTLSETFFADKDDYNINNSYYFSAHNFLKKESLYVRLAFRGISVVETWVYFQKDNKKYYLSTLYYDADKSPLNVKMIKECCYEVEFNGELVDEVGEKVNAKLKFDFTPTRPIVDFFYHSPEVRMAKAMAFESWKNGYFDNYRENNQVHYEQVGFIKGEMVVDNENIHIELDAVRDHSYGKRDWTYMNNHIWLMGVSKNKELNFSMVSYPTMTCLEVGNYFSNNDVFYVLKAEYNRGLFINDKAPENFNMKLYLTNKKQIEIKVNKITEQHYLFQDGGYLLIEGICEIEIEGEIIRGILEVGFNKDKKRYFNGHDTKEIKA